jgi:hypothetical protein
VREERRIVGRDRWVIDPPAGHDPGMARDGIAAPAAGDARAELLEEVVARTPLDTWIGAGRTPADVLAMPATEEWAPAFRRGLARAAVALRSPEWAAALVGAPDVRPDPALHRLLPPERLAAHLAGRLRTDPEGAARLLDDLPGPWPEPLAKAVVDALTAMVRGGTPVWHLRELCSLAAPALPVGWAPRLRALAEHTAATTPGSRAADAVTTLAAALTFRHDMIEELR